MSRRNLLDVINDYDSEQCDYIAELEAKVEKLTAEKMGLVNQLVSYTQTVDRMKLDLIMSGALSRPVVDEAIAEAKASRFGEAQNEPLNAFLSCEAFENRMDPERARAFSLAARIVKGALEKS